MTQLNFNARTVAPNSGTPDPVPAGWYNVMIDQSEEKPTGNGNGAYLELRFNVLDGQYAGRKLFHRLNLKNQNAQAVEIAFGQLSAICHAVNVMDVPDSQVLHGIPLKVKVAVRAGGPKLDKQTGQPTGEMYEPSNDIKKFENINADTSGAGVSQPQGPQHGAPTGYQQPQFTPPPAQPPAQYAPQGGFGQQPQGAPQYAQQPPQGAPAYGQPPQGFQAQPPAQAPAQQPWQGQPAQQPQGQGMPQGAPQGSQPWQGAGQAQPPAQQPQGGAPAQPWQNGGQQPQAQQPAFQAQQPAQGGQLPPWQQPRQ